MEPFAILIADPLDLIFENRNKAYGAYPLRKFYSRRLMVAVTCACGAGIMFFALAAPESEGLPVRNIIRGDYTIQSLPDVPVPKKPVPVVKTPAAHRAAVAYTNLRIVPDHLADKPSPTVSLLTGARIAAMELAGSADGGTVLPASGDGVQGKEPIPALPAAEQVLKRTEVMPQFPGGADALLRFLRKNLRMPEESAAPGTHVSVLAQFVVGTDGKVRDATLIRSGGRAFDREVFRVIGRMPDWIPGSQNHRPVPVYFSLPVQFVVPDED